METSGTVSAGAHPELEKFRRHELDRMPGGYDSRVEAERRTRHLNLILNHPGYPLKNFVQNPVGWELTRQGLGYHLTTFSMNGPWSMPNVTAAVALHTGSIQKAGLYPRSDGTILIDTEFRVPSDAALAAFGRTLADRFGSLGNTTRDPPCDQPRDLTIEGREVSGATVLEIGAADSRGLLFRITRAFALQGIKIVNAEISTVQGRAHDLFTVTGRDGRPLDTAKEIPYLKREILREKF